MFSIFLKNIFSLNQNITKVTGHVIQRDYKSKDPKGKNKVL